MTSQDNFAVRFAKHKEELDTLTVDKLDSILAFAEEAASITTSRHGAIPAMPTLEGIETY